MRAIDVLDKTPMRKGFLSINRDTWRALDAEKRRLLDTSDLSTEEKLRRGQRLFAQAVTLHRSIIRASALHRPADHIEKND